MPLITICLGGGSLESGVMRFASDSGGVGESDGDCDIRIVGKGNFWDKIVRGSIATGTMGGLTGHPLHPPHPYALLRMIRNSHGAVIS
jgi:hypothetical protein